MGVNIPALISLGATVIVGVAFVWLAVETHLLLRDQTPISSYVRAIVKRWPGPAIAVGGAVVFIVGMFFAHFVWDAPYG